jgi:hypothetical protein
VGLGRHTGADPSRTYFAVREQAGREASPTVAINDAQSGKGEKKGASLDPSGYDAGKKG